MSFRNISLADVIRVPHYNGDNLKEVLYQLGIDTTKDIDEVVCNHRTLDNKGVTCLLYMGKERFDREWLQSGNSSLEAVFSSTNDLSLRQELNSMNKRANYLQGGKE